MKKIYKLFLVFALFLVGLFSAVPAKADITGSGDAALLAQQILQWFQDFTQRSDSYDVLLKGVEEAQEKLDQVRDITETAQGISNTAKSVYNYTRLTTVLTRHMIDTSKEMLQNYQYVCQHGSENDIFHCYQAYLRYNSMTSGMISNIADIAMDIAKYTKDPNDAANKIYENYEKVANSIAKYGRDCSEEIWRYVKNAINNAKNGQGSEIKTGVANEKKEDRNIII